MTSPLDNVAELLRRTTGIVIRREQLPALEAAIARVQPGLDARAFLAARVDRANGAALLSRLIDEVTIRETYFMRQPEELYAIDWNSLRASSARDGRARINVWVAACASGEEAYSLALLAHRAFPSSEPPVSILATDISNTALAAAHHGRYGGRSLRTVGQRERERYFTVDGQHMIVGGELRRLVTFKRHNLVDDPIPPDRAAPFDLIACRNVLIYFGGESIERVIGSLEQALAPDGTLLLGAADRLCGSARRLERIKGPPRPKRRPTSARARARQPEPAVGTRQSDGRADRESDSPGEALEAVDAEQRKSAIDDALRLADSGELARALEGVTRVLEADPLDSDAYFIRGMAELGLGDPEAAVGSFRRALYVDPSFGLAAFNLARSHEACGDLVAAYRAYERALRTPRTGDGRHAVLVDHVDAGDIAAACAIRLRALSDVLAGTPGAGGTACES